MLPRRRTIAKRARDAEDPDRCPKHLRFVRSFVCAAWKSGECSGPIVAHHIRSAATAGMGVKPSDRDTVSLCAMHHDLGHLIGWDTFEAKYSVDLMAEAQKLAKASPHLRGRS